MSEQSQEFTLHGSKIVRLKMAEEKNLVTEAEAQGMVRRFLLMRYPQAGITFNSVQLLIKESIPIYQVQGQLTKRSRNPLNRFLFPTQPNQHSFKVELHASQRKVLHYEFH